MPSPELLFTFFSSTETVAHMPLPEGSATLQGVVPSTCLTFYVLFEVGLTIGGPSPFYVISIQKKPFLF